MQNTTRVPVRYPGFKEWNPSDHPHRRTPVDTILDAVHAGDLAQVTSLVADPSYSPDDYLEKALIAAVTADQLEIGRYLLDHGAVVDKPVLHIMPGSWAARKKSLPFFKLFVERGWDVNSTDLGRTALFYVIEDHEFVTWLLAHGADPNLGHENNMNVGGHLLDVAALTSTVEIFDELIAHGARLEDSLALFQAAAARPHGLLGRNDTRLMARLLELGLDINEPDHKGTMQNGMIGQPIFWAIRAGQIANVRFLVEHGADLTVKGTIRTPVEVARTMGYKEITDFLESLSPKGV